MVLPGLHGTFANCPPRLPQGSVSASLQTMDGNGFECRKMAVYDCFTFFNELDILELRLAELSPHVDFFVLAEATRTFTGAPKPLYFKDNSERFKQHADKIIHVVIEDLPLDGDAWSREAFQRNAIVRGLGDAQPDDIILLSDVDEIPRPEVLSQLSPAAVAGCIHFIEHEYYTYKLNLRILDKWIGLCATRAVQMKHLPAMQELRATRARQSRRLPAGVNTALTMLRNRLRFGHFLRHVVHETSGWHFTFINSAESIRYKIASYAHQERNTPEFNSIENISRLIATGTSICGRRLQRVPDARLPATVQANRARYATWLSDGGANEAAAGAGSGGRRVAPGRIEAPVAAATVR